jgi:hypothetical protein
VATKISLHLLLLLEVPVAGLHKYMYVKMVVIFNPDITTGQTESMGPPCFLNSLTLMLQKQGVPIGFL